MKTIVLLAAVSISYSANSKTEQGSGKTKEESRELKDFTGISLSQSLQAQLSVGPFKVQIKGDDNILPFIETEVTQGVLRVKFKNGVSYNTENPVEVFIQAPVINSIDLSGASRLSGNIAKHDNLEIDTSGSSVVKLDKLDIKDLKIESSGASNVKLEQLAGTSLNIDSSGGCTVALGKVDVKTLSIEASGASSINLEGTSEKIGIDVAGGSKLKANQLKAKHATIEVSGASEAQLKSVQVITGDLSGGSTVIAAKSARVEINHSSASRLIQE